MRLILRCVLGCVAVALSVHVSPAWSAPPPILRNQPLTIPAAPTPTAPAPVAPAPTSTEPPQFAGMVAAHNRARGAVGVPDLAWSDPLARTAQSWAEKLRTTQCEMRHSRTSGLGENLAWASGQHLRPEGVVALWVQEARAFSPATGICAPGAVCGHYTQVVWRKTRLVGCGMAACGNSEVWVCNYTPPGNVSGELPY